MVGKAGMLLAKIMNTARRRRDSSKVSSAPQLPAFYQVEADRTDISIGGVQPNRFGTWCGCNTQLASEIHGVWVRASVAVEQLFV